MVREAQVRKALGLGQNDELDERGVFSPRDAPELAENPPGAEKLEGPGNGGVLLTDEWLSDQELEEHVSEEPDVAAGIPRPRAIPAARARVKRLDIEPRILFFEQVPEPKHSLGAVRAIREGRWVMDSRRESALVFPDKDHDIVVWGEDGTVRLFALRRAA